MRKSALLAFLAAILQEIAAYFFACFVHYALPSSRSRVGVVPMRSLNHLIHSLLHTWSTFNQSCHVRVTLDESGYVRSSSVIQVMTESALRAISTVAGSQIELAWLFVVE